MRNWLITTEAPVIENYQGITIHAVSGLHEDIADLCLKYIPANSRVLDVGAGAGAMSQRLFDLKYDVTALDIDKEKWKPDHIPFFVLDIDAGVSKSIDNQFDAIVCLEVIEHVENHWNLMRDLYQSIKPGGILIVSTPNVSSFVGRIMFLIYGEMLSFQEISLSYGHINPITHFHLSHLARKTGWEIIETCASGYLAIFDFSTFRLRKIMSNFLRGPLYPFMRDHKRGVCHVFVLKKPLN